MKQRKIAKEETKIFILFEIHNFPRPFLIAFHEETLLTDPTSFMQSSYFLLI